MHGEEAEKGVREGAVELGSRRKGLGEWEGRGDG
jgi:hypothetical protein